ncbi:uncharacterized protein LOC108666118 isoform X3 [Hyalella azteca]|uniref:Uncharacterized protein LOC108666118 isoform X3 n=1 Tax=Hyalella azteca TaxID=294128 RepID=A0A8B7N3J4_HYAAZ|nr:uncharacterized protein LOC108666118 isoform X3 [Hyalella azteca]
MKSNFLQNFYSSKLKVTDNNTSSMQATKETNSTPENETMCQIGDRQTSSQAPHTEENQASSQVPHTEENQASSQAPHTEENQASSQAPNLVRSTCGVCLAAPARYRCPACAAVTCSCACVAAHKLRTNCTGVREPVLAVQKEDMDDDMLQQDYRFLESVMSRLERSLRDPKVHHLVEDIYVTKKRDKQSGKRHNDEESLVHKHRFSLHNVDERTKKRFKAFIPNYGGRNRFHQNAGVTLHRGDLPSGLKRLRYEARLRGTQLAFMPRDMTRHAVNTTHYLFRHQVIRWRVRVEFLQANVYSEDTWDERISIGRIISKFLDMAPEDMRGWPIDHTSESSAGVHSTQDKEERAMPCVCGTDPLNSHWSEEVSNDENRVGLDNNDQSSLGEHGAEVKNVTRQFRRACKSGKLNSSCPKCTVSSQEYFSPSANHDQISLTLNTECNTESLEDHSRDYPLAIDITRVRRENKAKSLTVEQMQQMSYFQSQGASQLAVLFKNEDFCQDQRHYVHVCLSDSLRESLSQLRVVEYPIFVVTTRAQAYEMACEDIEKGDDYETADRCNKISKSKPDDTTAKKTFRFFDAECSDDSVDEG